VLGRVASKKQFVPFLCWDSTKIQPGSPNREGASSFGPNWRTNFGSEKIQSQDHTKILSTADVYIYLLVK
jgi:hypothetical protein